jgi:hypothetical protein
MVIRRVSLYKARKQAVSINKERVRQSRVAYVNSPATRSHHDSSEPTTKSQNSGIQMGDHERSKFLTSSSTNFEILLYIGYVLK